MSRIVLPHEWEPRDYQLPFLRRMSPCIPGGGGRRACWSGIAAPARISTASTSPPCAGASSGRGLLAHAAHRHPGEEAVWDGIDAQGRKVLDQVFPSARCAKPPTSPR
jgi:hypothetical protein